MNHPIKALGKKNTNPKTKLNYSSLQGLIPDGWSLEDFFTLDTKETISPSIESIHFDSPFRPSLPKVKNDHRYKKDKDGVIWNLKNEIIVILGSESHFEKVMEHHPEYQNKFRDGVVVNETHSQVRQNINKSHFLYIGRNVKTLDYDSLFRFDAFHVSKENPFYQKIDLDGEDNGHNYGLYEVLTESLLYADRFPRKVPVKVRRLSHHAIGNGGSFGMIPCLFEGGKSREGIFRDLEVIEKGNHFTGTVHQSEIYTDEASISKKISDIGFYLPMVIPKRVTFFSPQATLENIPLIINESPSCFKGVRFLSSKRIKDIQKENFNSEKYYSSLAEDFESHINFLTDMILQLNEGSRYLSDFLSTISFRFHVLERIQTHLRKINYDNVEINSLLLNLMQKKKPINLSLDDDPENQLEESFYYTKKGRTYYPLYLKENIAFSLPLLLKSDHPKIDYRYLSLSNHPKGLILKNATCKTLAMLAFRNREINPPIYWLFDRLEMQEQFHSFSFADSIKDFPEDRKKHAQTQDRLYVSDSFLQKNGTVTTKDLEILMRNLSHTRDNTTDKNLIQKPLTEEGMMNLSFVQDNLTFQNADISGKFEVKIEIIPYFVNKEKHTQDFLLLDDQAFGKGYIDSHGEIKLERLIFHPFSKLR